MSHNVYRTDKVLLIFLLGISIRYWLISSSYQKKIANHIEVSTPLNSWKRVAEGLYLQSQGINPYEGDLLHEAPLIMLLYKTLLQIMSVETMFLLTDTLTAIMLYFVAKLNMFQSFMKEEATKDELPEENKEFLLNGVQLLNSPVFAVAAFLLSPYTILNCVGFSTTVFHNFFLIIFIFVMLSGSLLCTTILAICAMMSLYPIILLLPLYLSFSRIHKSKFKAVTSIFLVIAQLVVFKHVSSLLTNGDLFIKNVYGFILTVPDLQPNIGLFWYFFTEMFDHFRELFLCSFQINAAILYLFPLAIKFRKDPFLVTVALIFLIAIFKSYPCVGDVGFALSLLPCLTHLLVHCQQGFIVGVILMVTTALSPILWHLWIYSNSANANFYFGVTLAFAIALIFLVTDVLFAHLKREFYIKFGKDRKVGGKDALLVLE